jgi:hypothetical protein
MTVQLPTPAEIRDAHEAADRDGPMAATTLSLVRLATLDPILNSITLRMTAELQAMLRADGMDPEIHRNTLHAALNGALISGLNIALRIAQERARKSSIRAAGLVTDQRRATPATTTFHAAELAIRSHTERQSAATSR